MTKTREKQEPDQWDTLLDQLDLRGLTQEEVLGQGGLVKQLTGRLLQKILKAEMTRKLRFRHIWGTTKTRTLGTTAGIAGTATPRKRC
jgi:transposase-like protein